MKDTDVLHSLDLANTAEEFARIAGLAGIAATPRQMLALAGDMAAETADGNTAIARRQCAREFLESYRAAQKFLGPDPLGNDNLDVASARLLLRNGEAFLNDVGVSWSNMTTTQIADLARSSGLPSASAFLRSYDAAKKVYTSEAIDPIKW